MSDEPVRGRNLGVADKPCAACPWRISNHGRPHPDGWYDADNLARLWDGLRTGEAPGMTCHPTDPQNPAPTGRPDAKADDGADFYECTGAHTVRQVEIRTLESSKNYADYVQRTQKPAMTREGLFTYIMDTQTAGAGAHLLGLTATVIHDVTEFADQVGR